MRQTSLKTQRSQGTARITEPLPGCRLCFGTCPWTEGAGFSVEFRSLMVDGSTDVRTRPFQEHISSAKSPFFNCRWTTTSFCPGFNLQWFWKGKVKGGSLTVIKRVATCSNRCWNLPLQRRCVSAPVSCLRGKWCVGAHLNVTLGKMYDK